MFKKKGLAVVVESKKVVEIEEFSTDEEVVVEGIVVGGVTVEGVVGEGVELVSSGFGVVRGAIVGKEQL